MKQLRIFVTDHEGTEHELEAVEGWRVMEIIREHGLKMKAECGGACACATCHVYVEKEWLPKISPKCEEEEDMLDEAIDPQGNSRLSCQIIMNEELDGLRLTLAPEG